MGEYATLDGQPIKIGTCEDFYYLRWDQRDKVSGYDFTYPGLLEASRFRFPFPSEDGTPPGAFEDYDRGLTLWGFAPPAELDHGLVQFSAQNGYLVSLPCPEGPQPEGATYRIGKNGYGGAAALVQQGWRSGRLVGIARCNGCHTRYRLEDGYEDVAAVCIRSQADTRAGSREVKRDLHLTADRLLEGYADAEAR